MVSCRCLLVSDKASEYTTENRFLMYTSNAKNCFWVTRDRKSRQHTQISPVFESEKEACEWIQSFSEVRKQTNNVVPFNKKVRGLFD